MRLSDVQNLLRAHTAASLYINCSSGDGSMYAALSAALDAAEALSSKAAASRLILFAGNIQSKMR